MYVNQYGVSMTIAITTREDKVNAIKKQITSLVDYMRVKIDQGDWHAVADAAMDIRELEAKIKVYEELK